MATRQLALALLRDRASLSSGELARAARVTRQAAHRQLRQLVAAGTLVREGGGRGARYLPPRQRATCTFPLVATDEHAVYRASVAALPALGVLPLAARELVEHALVELAANALEHSSGTELRVTAELGSGRARLTVEDDGVGAFERVRRALGLESCLDAVLALEKGPVRCDPLRHRGEALWFVRNTADRFELEANQLSTWTDTRRGEAGVLAAKQRPGTRVVVEIAVDTTRRVRDALERVTLEHAFARTKLALRLFSLGPRLVSRVEARRVLDGLEGMSEVVLDFAGVEWVSQSFADEAFRVWARAHPKTKLVPANANDDVAFVIRRARLEA